MYKNLIKQVVFTLTGLCILAMPAISQAGVIKYNLFDHPNGNQVPPTYGLRLDGLFGSGVHTFEFQSMMMEIDVVNSTVDIMGTIFGGRINNSGDDYATGKAGTWDVAFSYSQGVNIVNTSTGEFVVGMDDLDEDNDDDSHVHGLNTGTITLQSAIDVDGIAGLDTGKVINLVDYKGINFLANNHRLSCGGDPGCGSPVGEGWLNHGVHFGAAPTSNHPTTMDWLFISQPKSVPEPFTVSLLGLGLLGLGAVRRKKTA